MREQLQALEESRWDVLIVLDTCRADMLRRALEARRGLWHAPGLGSTCDTVRSPASCTMDWVAAVGMHIERRGAIWFTANPVVNRQTAKNKFRIPVEGIWRDLWGRFTPLGVPSVHSQALSAYVLARSCDLGKRPFIVHYLQPHSPYAAEPPLAVSRWGRSGGAFGEACAALKHPEAAVRDGDTTWQEVRAAYYGNLCAALEAVDVLLNGLRAYLPGPRTIVLTADHGELLGERGHFGHECEWRDAELREVPWMQMPLNASLATRGEEGASLHSRLEAARAAGAKTIWSS